MSWVHAVVFIVARLTSPALGSSDIQELCPYTRFCTEEPLSVLNDSDTRPCCMPCSCSDDCYAFGNCCPDKSGGVVPQTVPCRTQAQIYSRYLNRPIQNHIEIELKVVDFCPEQAYSDNALQKASQRCLYGSELEDLVFVSDENDRIYLNRFCAECNGVTSFITWDLHIPCYDMLESEVSFQELTNFIFDRCDVYSKPPAEVNLGLMACSTVGIAKCNVTGWWDFYDPEIDRNCRNNVLIPYVTQLRNWYANIYCFICNNPLNTSTSSKCDVLEVKESGFALFPSFTAVLKFPESTEWERQHHGARSGGCTDMEVFDPFTRRCLKLLCPYGTLPTDGMCKRYVETLENFCLGISLGVRLTTQQKSIFQSTDAKNLANSTRKMVKKIFNHLGIDCGFGDLLITDTQTSDICVDIAIASSETCDHLKLLEASALLTRETMVDATVDEKNVSLPLFVCDKQQWYMLYFGAKNYLFDEGVDCLPAPFTYQTVYCPSIEYNPNNTHFESDIAIELLNISVQIDEERYRVCLADYKTITTPLISAGCTGTVANMVVVMITWVALALDPIYFDIRQGFR